MHLNITIVTKENYIRRTKISLEKKFWKTFTNTYTRFEQIFRYNTFTLL